MQIKSVTLKNFRAYRKETTLEFDNLTVLVGKNDIGKSTFLEALDIFFNDGNGSIKFDKSDINVHALQDNEEAEITVCFSDLPDRVIIDSSVETTLPGEFLLNENGDLEIVKKYKSSGKTSIFIRAYHPTNPGCDDLLLKKNADLKRILKKLDLPCSNQGINKVIRETIWDYYKNELECKTKLIDAAKEDSKKIWESLSKFMPIYSLFQSDRKNSDNDNEVQDPLKLAVKTIMADPDIQRSLSEVSQKVRDKLQEVSNKTLEKLNDLDPKVANSLSPSIPPSDSLKWNDVFKNVSITGDEAIPINKRGSGVRRLILISFFRAEAERKMSEKDSPGIIYAIEEPETSQHAQNQILLIKALKDIAAKPNAQILLTTHSSTIVKELDFANIRAIQNDDGENCVNSIEEAALVYPSLNEVNYLVFDDASIEYHDELYGTIEAHGWKNELICKSRISHDMLNYIDSRHPERPGQKCISEYIRHQIHHPENHYNPLYTREQLVRSIIIMRSLILEKRHEIS